MRGIVAVLGAAALAAGVSIVLRAQEPTASQTPLTFDVAAVKPTPPEVQQGIIHQLPGNQTYEIIGVPLRLIMTVAYTVTDRQISGGPDWINNDRWTIQAKADRRGTSDELHDALARLIEDRFQLKIRHETRELSVYILTADKGGAKMPLHDAADLVHEPIAGGPLQGLKGQNVTMNYFAFFLSRIMNMNVLDRTNLPDHYDVKLHFMPELPPGAVLRGGDGAPVAVTGDEPDIYTALREQLGLKLEKGKGPVDHLVVEHAAKPSDN